MSISATRKTGQLAGVPTGGFRTILVDPPWPAQSGERHYRTMSLDQIQALPVGSLAARNSGCGRPTLCCRGRTKWLKSGASLYAVP